MLPYLRFHIRLEGTHTETEACADKELLFTACHIKVVSRFHKKELIIEIYVRSNHNTILPMPEVILKMV
jgi:hypothetical protein